MRKRGTDAVRRALEQAGIDCEIRQFARSTRSAAEAALALGCDVGQIVKSLVFRMAETAEPVLVLASGRNRVDENKVHAILGQRIGKADAGFVRRSTGFAIGGVPPVGHDGTLPTVVDADLSQYPVLWASAGSANAVFCCTPAFLNNLGTVAEIRESRRHSSP